MVEPQTPKRAASRPTVTAAGAVIGLLAAVGLIAYGANTNLDSNPPLTTLPAVPVVSSTEVPDTWPAPAPNRPAGVPAAGADSGAEAELAKLDTLAIKGRAPKTGYDRELFGPAWSDDVTVADGHNGCDTRNDILRRDLVDLEIKPETHGCVVLSGILNDPYTGMTIEFERGRGTSREVQIDHVVALSDAWQKGAQQWDEDTRRNFANDPMNLRATDGEANERKGDGDAATWLPPNKSYRCAYVSRIVDVKATYGVWVTQAEHDAIARILTAGCGAPAAPPDTPVPVAPAAPPDTPVPLAPAAPPPEDQSSVYHPNCTAARAAGAAPLHVGGPGYRAGLDDDDDGIACELLGAQE